jgi:hypothetical protein
MVGLLGLSPGRDVAREVSPPGYTPPIGANSRVARSPRRSSSTDSADCFRWHLQIAPHFEGIYLPIHEIPPRRHSPPARLFAPFLHRVTPSESTEPPASLDPRPQSSRCGRLSHAFENDTMGLIRSAPRPFTPPSAPTGPTCQCNRTMPGSDEKSPRPAGLRRTSGRTASLAIAEWITRLI